jgi:hypothetical protein
VVVRYSPPPPSGTAKPTRNSHRFDSNLGRYKTLANVVNAVKGSNGEEEEDADSTAALLYAVAPVGAPSVYCCGGSEARIAAAAPRRLREATRSRNRTATRLLRCHTRWRPWGRLACICAAAPRRGRDATATRLIRLRTRWRPWKRQACNRAAVPRRGRDTTAMRLLRMRTRWRPLEREWRGYRKSWCCAEQRRFHNSQVTRHDLVARRATRYLRKLASRSGTHLRSADTVVAGYNSKKTCGIVSAHKLSPWHQS